MSSFRHLFGPVPSRRLGLSLGVDLTPHKTCSLDCVFCQLGPTTEKTTRRTGLVPTEEVVSEIEQWQMEDGVADYITLSGSGEPTLNPGFGGVLEAIADTCDAPSALLSNGTLFWMPEVRRAAARARVVKLSLGAWDQQSFERLNRPHPDLLFDSVLEGQAAFRREFSGTLWSEVFLVKGINDLPEQVEKIAEALRSVRPDEIHLNTSVRPPAEDFAEPLGSGEMEALAGLFTPVARVMAEYSADRTDSIRANEETLMAMLRRRPCTPAQIARAFGMHPNEVSKYLGKLVRTGRAETRSRNAQVYYLAIEDSTGETGR
ncbi:radical SAM protein [Candidatus Fermentibacterales bacterium]|nr:radical SAM protein [Candidatus Fermentibacterales bacterium]